MDWVDKLACSFSFKILSEETHTKPVATSSYQPGWREDRYGLMRTKKKIHSAAATFLDWSDRLASGESLCTLEGILSLTGGLGLRNIVFDFSGHGREGRLDVSALLSGSLEEAHTVMVGHLLTLFEGNSSSVLQISLVTDQDASYVILSVLFDFTHPGVDSVEGVAVGDIVHNDNAVRTLVVAGSDGLESLLACSVPDL